MKTRIIINWLVLIFALLGYHATAKDIRLSKADKREIKQLLADYRAGKQLTEEQFIRMRPYLPRPAGSSQPLSTTAAQLAAAMQASLFAEDFSGGFLPPGWENIDHSGSGELWRFDNPGERTINTTTGANGFAIFDSDNNSEESPPENSDLISPAIDCSGAAVVIFTFEHYFKAGYGGYGEVGVSANNGATWSVLESWADSSTANAQLQVYDISAIAAGQSQVRLRWKWTGDWSWWWAVDDVSVFEPTGGMLLTSTDHVDFGPTVVNQDNSVTIQLFNAGTAVNIFSAVSDDPRFTVSGVPASLPTAGSASFTVTFTPLTTGAFSGTISINHDGVNGSPLMIAVEGLGYEVPIVALPWNEPFSAAGFDPATWDILSSGNPEVIDSSGTSFSPFPHALPSAPYMLEISGGENPGDPPDAVSTGFFDLSGAANLALTFWKSEHDLEIGEYVLISYLANNGQWKTLDSLAGTDNGFGLFEPFTRVELKLPADAYHAQFRLRFSASPDMSDVDEYYFDNFTLDVGNLLPEPRNLVGQARDGAADLAWEPPPALLNKLLQHSGDGLSKVSPAQKNAAHSSAENSRTNAEEILNLIRYRIYRSEDGSNFSVIDSVQGVITMFSDSNVVNGNTYWYQVTAIHDEGESDPSNMVPVTPQALPGNLLLFESFEGSFPPPGWHKFNFDGGTVGWTKQLIGISPVPGFDGGILTGPPNGGTAVAFCSWHTGGPENFPNDQWLVTPQITNVVEDDSLHFWLRYWPNIYNDTLDVLISPAGNSDPADFYITAATLGFGPDGDTLDTWRKYSYRIGDFVRGGENIYIAFRERVPDNYVDGASFSFDQLMYIRAEVPETPQKLLISEFAAAPDQGEFVEIYNPGFAAVKLNNYYLTDATVRSSGVFYYQIVEGGGGGGKFGDWHARFPEEAQIQPREYQTVAMNGAAFAAHYGLQPTYELFDSDGNIPDMRAARPGSIDKVSTNLLDDNHEAVILYYWDGTSDLVGDVDYLIYDDAAPDNDEQVDKTAIRIDGPDASSDSSQYLADTPVDHQMWAPVAAAGFSTQRIDFTEGAQIPDRSNGITGANETSEDLNNTFTAAFAPTPNASAPTAAGLNPPRSLLVLAEGNQVDLSWVAPLPPGELGYDDDSEELGLGFSGSPGEYAVRFTPTAYPATLVGIKTYWSDIANPSNNAQYSVWVNPEGGDNPPAVEVLGNTVYTVTVRNDFSTVDLSAAGITINKGDIYISWRQTGAANYGIGVDVGGFDYTRTWLSFDDGASWQKLGVFGFTDNVVVRALVLEGGGFTSRLLELPPAPSTGNRPTVDKSFIRKHAGKLQMLLPKALAGEKFSKPLAGRNPQLTSQDPQLKSGSFDPDLPPGIGASLSGSKLKTTRSASGYHIWRSEDGVNFSVIASVDSLTTTYTDQGVSAGITYWYAVSALFARGESPLSNLMAVLPGQAAEAFNDHVTAVYRASVTNEGTIGYLNNSPPFGSGNGFQFNPPTSDGQRLFDGGIIVATGAEQVSDGVRDENDLFDMDFRRISSFDSTLSTGNMQTLRTAFDDFDAEKPIGIRVEQTSYSIDTAQAQNIFFFALDVHNTGNADLPEVYVGAFLDWDIGPDFLDRGQVITDSLNFIPGVNNNQPFPVEILEMHAGNSPDAWMGVVPLSTNLFHARRILISETEVYPPHMTDADKWEYLTTNRPGNPNGDGGFAQDHSQVFGLPPVDIAVGRAAKVGFALVAGTSLTEMVAAARRAQSIWVLELDNEIRIESPVGIADEPLSRLPQEFALAQNYPNPFNPATAIKYALKDNGLVSLKIYNMLGQLVKVLVNAPQPAGFKEVLWDGANESGGKVASGIYIYTLEVRSPASPDKVFTQTRKMFLMK